MIVIKGSKLYALNGEEVAAIAASVDGAYPTLGFSRNFILMGLGVMRTECNGLINHLLESRRISLKEAEENRQICDARVEFIQTTIDKVEALSEIDCTYLLGLAHGFMAGTGEMTLGQQWDYGSSIAADLDG
jgi:nucleoside permease NupC